jgi:hypothetical protein
VPPVLPPLCVCTVICSSCASTGIQLGMKSVPGVEFAGSSCLCSLLTGLAGDLKGVGAFLSVTEPAVPSCFPWSDVTEERRLVAEEGTFSKKTWLPKIARWIFFFFGQASSCLGPWSTAGARWILCAAPVPLREVGQLKGLSH